MPKGYFFQLKQIRGKTKKTKVMEQAREAVANGVAVKDKIKIAAHGADPNGKVVPAQEIDHNQYNILDFMSMANESTRKLGRRRLRSTTCI